MPGVQVLESTLARVIPGARSLARCSLSFSWESEYLKKYVGNKIDFFVQTSSGIYELVGAVSWGRNCAKSFGVYADLPCKFRFTWFHYLSSISTNSTSLQFHFNQFHHYNSISTNSIIWVQFHTVPWKIVWTSTFPCQTTASGSWTMWAQSSLLDKHQKNNKIY